jgi:TIR domain
MVVAEMSGEEGKDFFISRTGADKAWAAWIGYVLEEEGYRVHLQDWDFRPGKSFVRNM